MESDRKWSECVSRVTKHVKHSMIRLNPTEVGNVDPFDATKCALVVEMTESKVNELSCVLKVESFAITHLNLSYVVM